MFSLRNLLKQRRAGAIPARRLNRRPCIHMNVCSPARPITAVSDTNTLLMTQTAVTWSKNNIPMDTSYSFATDHLKSTHLPENKLNSEDESVTGLRKKTTVNIFVYCSNAIVLLSAGPCNFSVQGTLFWRALLKQRATQSVLRET